MGLLTGPIILYLPVLDLVVVKHNVMILHSLFTFSFVELAARERTTSQSPRNCSCICHCLCM